MSANSGAFDQAIALGHHWAGEEHFLLALVGDEPSGDSLLAPLGLTWDEVASAVAARVDALGPPVVKEFRGCISAPSHHTVLGRAQGFALGLGSAVPGQADVLAALFWDPAASPSELLEMVGRTRADALDIVARTGRILPVAPGANPLTGPAEREATTLGYSFFGDDHVVLALLADEPDDRAGHVLRQAGTSHQRMAARIVEMSTGSDPPTVLTPGVTSANPNPRCRQLLGRAEGLAATLGDGVVSSAAGLAAYLWQDDGQPTLMLEALDVSMSGVLEALTDLGATLPSVPLPQPNRTPWGENVPVPIDRLDDVVARLGALLSPGSWGWNSHDGRGWVSAHAHIDLEAVVADVLAP